eukprot:CAMPEP_0176324540 /NCGR_PEP_ID=MMETSP0121_2-20121125/72946_1 /TAXON_ID=160619 /ORGANISM="Kryptoperidinium foliaceum, Strain CCMP 1326" /LENGTH=52 /DNA_ID=CAMNT_0017667075 /DNA_START=8 /DNA_END=162 /DNA_ORIENTATION=+
MAPRHVVFSDSASATSSPPTPSAEKSRTPGAAPDASASCSTSSSQLSAQDMG